MKTRQCFIKLFGEKRKGKQEVVMEDEERDFWTQLMFRCDLWEIQQDKDSDVRDS